MLKITLPDTEFYDEEANEFRYIKGSDLVLEHSLISISKWESKWLKPFYNKKSEKTSEELLDYIRCMTLTQNVDPLIYYSLDKKTVQQIKEYMDSPMTATTFTTINSSNKKPNNSIITSEVIYYWMISYNIPMECQKWHINRLLTLIKVCSIKNSPERKMSKNEILQKNKELNAKRRAAMKSMG